jgi:hypothetical protein
MESPKTPNKPVQGLGKAGGPGDEMEALYKDILSQHRNAWGGIESGIAANTALNQRRMANMNAGMGRSVAGGFGGMMAQAILGGQQNLANARLQHDKEGRQLQMDWLDKQLHRQEREEDRAFQLASESSGVPQGYGGDGVVTAGETAAYQFYKKYGRWPAPGEAEALNASAMGSL